MVHRTLSRSPAHCTTIIGSNRISRSVFGFDISGEFLFLLPLCYHFARRFAFSFLFFRNWFRKPDGPPLADRGAVVESRLWVFNIGLARGDPSNRRMAIWGPQP